MSIDPHMNPVLGRDVAGLLLAKPFPYLLFTQGKLCYCHIDLNTFIFYLNGFIVFQGKQIVGHPVKHFPILATAFNM